MATQEHKSALRSSMIFLAGGICMLTALTFIPAGTLDWPDGWAFMAMLLVLLPAAIYSLWRVNPDIYLARTSIHAGTKSWDYIYFVIIVCGFLDVPVVAGLDYRWNWSEVPTGVVWFGRILFVVSLLLQWWAQAVNPHFETTVRIQTDRGHRVIDAGPYAHIRHPGYISAITLVVSIALALGSYWALLPAAVVIIAIYLRTNAEDELLQKELSGYAEYALRVRFKWIPGLW